MLLSAVSVLVVGQSSSEIPEGLMNNPVQLELVIDQLFQMGPPKKKPSTPLQPAESKNSVLGNSEV